MGDSIDAVQVPSGSFRKSSRRSVPSPKNGRLDHQNSQSKPDIARALAMLRERLRERQRAHAGPADVRSSEAALDIARLDELSLSAYIATSCLPAERAASG
jgi:hypothetical protein